jgi:hypothetical protein
MTLIDRVNVESVASQFVDKCVHMVLHFAASAVSVSGHANDNTGWTPILDKRVDCFVIDAVVAIGDDAQRARGTRNVLTNGDANAS